jgi:hypothetical protein
MFSVWHDNEEQWIREDADSPSLVCVAHSYIEAAEKMADDIDEGAFIVRDDATGMFRRIRLERGWSLKSDAPVTLEELCAP